jgi:hypothetical protein
MRSRVGSGRSFETRRGASRPPDEASRASAPTPDDVDVAGFVDGWLSRMNGRVVRDFGRFLAYLEHVAPLGCGFMSRFTHLAPSEQDQVLSSLQASRSDLLRAGFEGLKALVFMGYYRDPRTWSRSRLRRAIRGSSGRGLAVSGALLRGRDLQPASLSLDVDAVVVGTGAGGSVALRELARAGLDVVALEQGART